MNLHTDRRPKQRLRLAAGPSVLSIFAHFRCAGSRGGAASASAGFLHCVRFHSGHPPRTVRPLFGGCANPVTKEKESSADSADAGWVYEDAIERAPESGDAADAMAALGRIRMQQQQDFGGAESLFQRALQLFPQHRQALYNYGVLQLKFRGDAAG